MEDNKSAISIRDIIYSIFRYKSIIIIMTIVGLIAGYIIAQLQTRMYEASVKMHIIGVQQVSEEYYQGIGGYRVHDTQMQIVQSEPVIRRAVEALHLNKRPIDFEKNFCHPLKRVILNYKLRKLKNELEGASEVERSQFMYRWAFNNLIANLSLELIPGTDIFRIIITDFDADVAIAMANVVSRAYTIVDQQQQYAELTQKYGTFHPSVQQLKDNIDLMTKKLSGDKLPDLDAVGTASVKIIEQAMSDYHPVGKRKLYYFFIALGISIAIGIGLAIGLDFIDQTFKSPQDIVTILNIPFLGSAPKLKNDKIPELYDETGEGEDEVFYKQFINDLSDQFYVFVKTMNLRTILITSIIKGEGNTSIAVNLAEILSQQNLLNILLIDANFINPMLHRIYRFPEGPGLINILEEHPVAFTQGKSMQTFEMKELLIENKINKIRDNLSILQAGKVSNNPSKIFNENIMKVILQNVSAKYDLILIDSTGLKTHKYVEKLALLVQGVALVLSEGKIRRQIIQNTISPLRQKNVNFFGAILNKRTFPIPEIIYKLV